MARKAKPPSPQLVLGSQDSAGQSLEVKLKAAASVPAAGLPMSRVVEIRDEQVSTVLARATDGELTAIFAARWGQVPHWMREMIRKEARLRGLDSSEADA